MIVSTQPQRSAGGFLAAAIVHATLFAVLIVLGRSAVDRHAHEDRDGAKERLTWLHGGGGGGGGEGRKESARRLRRAGRDAASMPAAPSTPTEPKTVTPSEPDPIDRVVIPVLPIGDALSSVMGIIETPVSASTRGDGEGPGAGGGKGEGLKGGRGPGVGKGENGMIGDGPYRDGDVGVTRPLPIHIERPRYTNEAMRARVQGKIVVECTVRPNGSCSNIRVVRGFDPAFGLDEEAQRAAALWQFKPGTRMGLAVPVVIHIDMDFTLR